jgi:hypothetical protein
MNARLLNAGWPNYDPFSWPKYPLFLMFAARTVTPEHPLDDRLCIDGLKPGQSYEEVRKGRRIPGVGDHGGEGGCPVPDGVGLSGILAARSGHRQLAAELLGAWKAGGYAGMAEVSRLAAGVRYATRRRRTMGRCRRPAWNSTSSAIRTPGFP